MDAGEGLGVGEEFALDGGLFVQEFGVVDG